MTNVAEGHSKAKKFFATVCFCDAVHMLHTVIASLFQL